MMNESRRKNRVASLIKDALGPLLIQEVQSPTSGLITVTRVEVSADLLTAHVYLSVYGGGDKEKVLALLEMRKGYVRKILASRVKLKYNPQLIFALDPVPEYEEKIDRVLGALKKDEKAPGRPDQPKDL
jgi:ribosome-binding factor A